MKAFFSLSVRKLYIDLTKVQINLFLLTHWSKLWAQSTSSWTQWTGIIISSKTFFEENFYIVSAKLKIWNALMTCFCTESWKQNNSLFCHKFLPARWWKLASFGPDWICVVYFKEVWVPTIFCSLGYHLFLEPSFPALKATRLLKNNRLNFDPASDGKLTLWYNSNLTTASKKFYWKVCIAG